MNELEFLALHGAVAGSMYWLHGVALKKIHEEFLQVEMNKGFLFLLIALLSVSYIAIPYLVVNLFIMQLDYDLYLDSLKAHVLKPIYFYLISYLVFSNRKLISL